jgi:hypothetical protein
MYMEVLTHVQTLVQENIYTIGIGLVVLVAVAAVAWFYLGRKSGEGFADKAPLENMARVNEATIGGEMPPQQMPQHEPMPQTDDEMAHAEAE